MNLVTQAKPRHLFINGKHRHMHGVRPEHPARTKMMAAAAPPPPQTMAAISALASEVDFRDLWVPIKDQGTIGDCTANGTCEVYEFFQPVNKRVPMSRLYTYGRSRRAEGTPLTEDSGCQVSTPVHIFSELGCPPESDYDYTDYETKFMSEPPESLDAIAAAHKYLYWYPVPDLQTLKAALSLRHPCVFGFPCPADMDSDETLKTGNINYPAPEVGFNGGHCTGICGYRDTMKIGNDVGTLILPNSWGTSVGEQGYFYLPQRYVSEGLAGGIFALCQVDGAA